MRRLSLCRMAESRREVPSTRRGAGYLVASRWRRRCQASWRLRQSCSAHHEWVGGGGSRVDPNALYLEIVADRIDAVLAAQAGILVAAERRQMADGTISVHPDRPSLYALGHANGTPDVAGPHARSQAEAHVVCDAHCVLLVLELDHGQHRPEHFLLRDPHLVPHAPHNRGLPDPPLAAPWT